MNLLLRSARNEDADTLVAVRRDAIMGLAPEYDLHAVRQWLNSASPNYGIDAIGSCTVFVAESESGVVGWIGFRTNKIEYVYARPKVGGVGTALMARAEALIATAGYEEALLDASPNAVPFYQHRGYRIVAAANADNSLPMSKALLHAA